MSKPSQGKRVAISIHPKAEDFVASGREVLAPPPAAPAPAAAPASSEPTKRLTIDVSESLHRRLRIYAAADGRRLADIVRELLDKNLPSA